MTHPLACSCENRSQPFLFLHTSDERPNARDIHLLNRDGAKLGLCQKRRQVQIGFEADVYGEGRNDTLDPGKTGIRASEVVEEDDAAAAAADAAHFARDPDRIGYNADEIWSVHDVEGVVGELEVGGIHLEQADVAETLAR